MFITYYNEYLVYVRLLMFSTREMRSRMESLVAAIRALLPTVSGVASLRVQNHLYGCYLLLEDIVQNHVALCDTRITGPHISFDLHQHFSDIGLRYGFAMDSQLRWLKPPVDYKEAWIAVFCNTKTVEEVDQIEESINHVIQELVPTEESFFVSTAETGELPRQWIEKALALLLPKEPYSDIIPVTESTTVDAHSEQKEIPQESSIPHKRHVSFALTRRNKLRLIPNNNAHQTLRRKGLAKAKA